MLGRYRQPLPMSVLLIVSDVDGAALVDSPLARSLAAQTDPGWTFDTTVTNPAAIVRVSASSAIQPGSLAAIRQTFIDHPDIHALIGDALVEDKRQLRAAWSPTASANDPATVDLVATRDGIRTGALADRFDVLGSVDIAAVGHLPVALIARPEPEKIDDRARAAVGRLVNGRRTAPPIDAVSVLIPTAGTRRGDGSRLLEDAIDAARGCGIAAEIVLIVGEEFDGDPHRLEGSDVRIVARPGPWNFSVAINTGLLVAAHDTVVLLNDDIEMIDDGWLSPLLDHLGDPGVSLVGPALLYPDRTVQHLGIVIDDALPLHTHVGATLDRLPHRLRHPREVAAVTAACAVGRRNDLMTVGGLNERLPVNFNDVDLCFKLQRQIGRVIVDPTVPLVHHESASREPVIESWEWETFVTRWGEIVDPWYHPGHHRPDDPDDRRRNADHLPPSEPHGSWPLRTPTLRPSVHRARLAAPAGESATQ